MKQSGAVNQPQHEQEENPMNMQNMVRGDVIAYEVAGRKIVARVVRNEWGTATRAGRFELASIRTGRALRLYPRGDVRPVALVPDRAPTYAAEGEGRS